MSKKEYDYDIALSFAGEDREYVEKIAYNLKEFGLNIFYDKYFEADLLGKDLYVHLDNVYQNNSRYCLIFISKYYKEKLWTNHERESAQARAFSKNIEYILPLKLDDTEIPGIRKTTGYLDARTKNIEEICKIILIKLGLFDELDQILQTLNYYLAPSYVITIIGSDLHFISDTENFEASYPIRLFLELERIGLLVDLFIMTAVVPH
ncbi:toll/interleukin-1 receptor domain-containing protein [Flavobacterium sp. PLA-1-15]|uniref:toll/interleukin-1 receptor domain-containing protein n=1 Tax=Flavobacterium sp. PLA-1-15 TaxID=3380533 RepID=UPI003B7E6A11